MRIIYLLLLISLVCLVSAKYLPDESTSRALLRNKRSLTDKTDNTVEDQSNESNDDDDDGDDDGDVKDNDSSEQKEIKCAEQQRKLQAKREKEERKREEQLQKEQRKREKLEAKIKEEERKLQEKLEKEQRKQEEKLAKEELKRAEKNAKEERKRAENNAKEERKRQEKMRKQIEKLEKKTLGSENKSADSSESEEDLDFEDIWKNYIYQKYDLTESSTDLEKDAAVNSYIQEELGLNANSSKNEYRQAVLQLVNIKLLGGNSSSGFQNYFVSHVNAIYIQKLQADIENKIAELDNDTALLQNVSLPWAPQAKQAIGEEKSILTSIAQFLSDVVPTWITGGKPASNTSMSSPPTSGTSPSAISNTASSNADLVPNSNEGSISTSESNNVGLVDGTVVVIDSVNADGVPSIVNTVPTDAGASVNSNINGSITSSNIDLNGNSSTDQSTGSTIDSNGATVTGTPSVSGPAVSEGSITNDILPSNSPDGNSPSDHATSNADNASSVSNIVPSDAAASVNLNIDAPTSSSNLDLNENSLIDQSTVSTVDSNGFEVTGSSSVSSPAVSEGSIANDILPSNSPVGNDAPSIVNTVPSDAGASVNSNMNASISSSNVDLNGNSSTDQSTGSTIDSNDSTVTGIPSVSGPAVSEGSITNDILATNSPTGNSPSDQATSNADNASSVSNIVPSDAAASVNLNIDAPTSSSNLDLNENSFIDQSTVSTVDSNGFAVTGSSSVSSPGVPEGSIANDILPSNSPVGNDAPSIVNTVPSASGASVNSNINAPISSSNVDLNGNSSTGQSTGSTIDSNGSTVTGTPSVLGPTVSEGSITNDILATNLPAGNSPSDQATSNADNASSVWNTVPSDAAASVNLNIDAPTSSSTLDLNENSLIDQSTVSTVDSNGFEVTGSSSVSSPAVPEGSVANDILPSNLPAGNDASSVVNTVTSNADSSVNSNIDAPTSSSNVDLNENSLTGQSAGSTVDNNGSAVTGATSVSDPTIPEGTDVKPIEVSNVVEASSVSPSAVGDVSSIDTSLTGSSDSQSPGSSISISASPSAESSTSINNLSTGTEASSSSVTSDADANPQVSNNNGSIANSDIQTVVESGISDNSSTLEVSVNTDNTVNADVGITSSIDVVTTVTPDQSQGQHLGTETISSNIDLSGTSINEATSIAGQITDSVSSSTGSSVNIVNDATLDTVSVGAEVAVENTEISTDISDPLNIATGPTSVTADVPMAETESTVATSSAGADPVAGSSSVPISAAEDTGLPLEAPDVTVQNNVDKPVDTTSTSQVNTAEVIDSTNIISTNFGDTTTMDTSSISNGTEVGTANALPASPGSSANTDITVVSSGIDESVINTTSVVSATTEITVTTPAPALDPISTSQEPISEVPVTVADVTDTSKLQSSNPAISGTELAGPEVITNETTVDNDATINKNVSVSPLEEVANTSVPIPTQTSLSENAVPVAVTVVFEPSVDSVLDIAGKLPSSTENIVPADGESATVASDNASTDAPITIDSFQLTPVAVEIPAVTEPKSTPVSTDSVPSTFTDTSANDITVSSSDVTLAPISEIVGTDSGLLGTSDVIVTTEVPLTAQQTNTPTIPEEVGASLLEVTQQ